MSKEERIKLFRICSSCSKEFEATIEPVLVEATRGLLTGSISTFQDCPFCKERNDIWIRIVIEENVE
ncbi:hypothetical protein LCGC14_1337120 [marine sediment metagenome]|uniref:Uncharacterized protein n=1 Tax=marine sediment metagenome TaxID=412755 RepID=A0A0F9L135_9ZZZZ